AIVGWTTLSLYTMAAERRPHRHLPSQHFASPSRRASQACAFVGRTTPFLCAGRGRGRAPVGGQESAVRPTACGEDWGPLWGRLYAGQRWSALPGVSVFHTVGRDEPGPTTPLHNIFSRPAGAPARHADS